MERFDTKVSSLYIAQIKRKYGIDMGENYNKPEDSGARVSKCPKAKEVKNILDNPVYVGKIAYGKSTTEKIKGIRDEYHRVENKLDVSDKHYDRKYQDMQERLDNLYDRVGEIDVLLKDINEKINRAYGKQITSKQVYQILKFFDKMYYKLTDLEKKEFFGI